MKKVLLFAIALTIFSVVSNRAAHALTYTSVNSFDDWQENQEGDCPIEVVRNGSSLNLKTSGSCDFRGGNVQKLYKSSIGMYCTIRVNELTERAWIGFGRYIGTFGENLIFAQMHLQKSDNKYSVEYFVRLRTSSGGHIENLAHGYIGEWEDPITSKSIVPFFRRIDDEIKFEVRDGDYTVHDEFSWRSDTKMGNIDRSSVIYALAFQAGSNSDATISDVRIIYPEGRITGSVGTPGQAKDVHVLGNYAYVADWSGYLHVIDVTNPAAPSIVESEDLTPDPTESLRGSQPSGLYVDEIYAYVASCLRGFQIVEIKAPTEAIFAGQSLLDGCSQDVFVSGDYAYVADGHYGLQIINISDPTNPRKVSSIETQSKSFSGGDVYVAGGKAYYATGSNRFCVIDVNNPESPKIDDSIETEGGNLLNGLAVSGDYAYVSGGGWGLYAIKISDPKNLEIVSQLSLNDWPWYFSCDVTVSGNYAYVANGSTLKKIDISDPNNLKVVASVDTPGYANAVYISGNHAFVACSSYGLTVIDIATFGNPIITATAGTGGIISPSGAVNVTSGASKTFTVTANTNRGYQLSDVKVDGTSQGAIGRYTFSNVTQDHTISASFALSAGTIKRSMYVDYLDGILENEDAQVELLNFAKEWGITSLILYGASRYVGHEVSPICENPDDIENCDTNKLCKFIIRAKKAENGYGILEVGTAEGICAHPPDSDNFDKDNFQRIIDYNTKRESEGGDSKDNGKVDFIVTEYEFWNGGSYNLFLNALNGINTMNKNGWDLAVYLGSITESQATTIRDMVDRVLLSCYVPEIYLSEGGLGLLYEYANNDASRRVEWFQNASNSNLEIWPIFSAEYHYDSRFMGCWFYKRNNDGYTIKESMEEAENSFRDSCTSDSSHCNNERIAGYTYFLYRCLIEPNCGVCVDSQGECKNEDIWPCYRTVKQGLLYLKYLSGKNITHDAKNILLVRGGIYEEAEEIKVDGVDGLIIEGGLNEMFRGAADPPTDTVVKPSKMTIEAPTGPQQKTILRNITIRP